jgi:hypothetical protein
VPPDIQPRCEICARLDAAYTEAVELWHRAVEALGRAVAAQVREAHLKSLRESARHTESVVQSRLLDCEAHAKSHEDLGYTLLSKR